MGIFKRDKKPIPKGSGLRRDPNKPGTFITRSGKTITVVQWSPRFIRLAIGPDKVIDKLTRHLVRADEGPRLPVEAWLVIGVTALPGARYIPESDSGCRDNLYPGTVTFMIGKNKIFEAELLVLMDLHYRLNHLEDDKAIYIRKTAEGLAHLSTTISRSHPEVIVDLKELTCALNAATKAWKKYYSAIPCGSFNDRDAILFTKHKHRITVEHEETLNEKIELELVVLERTPG